MTQEIGKGIKKMKMQVAARLETVPVREITKG